MSGEILTMTTQQFERAALMKQIQDRRLTQRKAAEILGLSLRQVERLYGLYKRSGAAGLASTRRGRPSNRKLSTELRSAALALVRRHYADFGPTLANEKLRERHQLKVSTETLRQWMVDELLWTPHLRRRERVHQPRRRRDCVGELIQIDGCDHDWFEERAPRCVLLVYVDDATSRLMQLHFCESESTFTYFAATAGYIQQHGKPVALYSDKASVFRVNAADPKGGARITQFGRAMSELNIDIICANSAPAKGRVERAHQTMQDRLVKELRLRGISTVDAANAYAAEFIADYNQRFAKPPFNDFSAHRPLLESEELDSVFQWKEQRKVSKNLTLLFRRELYLLDDSLDTRLLTGKHVTVCEADNGQVQVHGPKGLIAVRRFSKEQARVTQGAIVSNKMLATVLTQIKDRQKLIDLESLKTLKSKRKRRLLKDRAATVAV